MGETYVIYNYHIYCSIYRIYIYIHMCVCLGERAEGMAQIVPIGVCVYV